MKLLILVLAAGALVMLPNAAVAQPLVPSVFYGSANIDGKPVADGTEIRGYVDGKDCTQLGEGYRGTFRDGDAAAYTIAVMHESQEPGCGREGKTVTFTIGGTPAEQTAEWMFIVQRIDLNAGSGEPVPLPTATPTSTVEPAGATATAIATATSAAATAPSTSPVPSGTPPTDPIVLPRTPQPPDSDTPGAQQLAGGDDDGGDGISVWLVVAGALLVLAGAGGAAGYWLSRRTGPPPS